MRITADIIDEELFGDGSINEKSVSELDERVKKYIHSSALAHERISQCQFQEMLRKFKKLTVSEQYSELNKSEFSKYSEASNSKQMDEIDGGAPTATVPTWLLSYLVKMKEEIKKEVIEELAGPACVIATKRYDKVASEFNEVVHEGIFCDHCDSLIRGIRYKCGNCSDFDLCQLCENIPNIHNKNHIFLKIRYSVPLKLKLRKSKDVSSNEIVCNLPDLPRLRTCPVVQVSRRRKVLDKTCRMLEATFIGDETVPDGTVLAPSTKFVKTWKVMNSGHRAWTKDTKLCFLRGSKDLRPTLFEIDVPFLNPGEEGLVSVLFISPSSPGVYQSYWQFCHKVRQKIYSLDSYLHCNIKVEAGNHEDGQNAVHVVTLPQIEINSEKDSENQKKEVANITQVLTAVKEEHDRGNMIPRKLVVTSHTATPTNTPFDLTPPKSPEPQETAVKELQDAISSNTEEEAKSNESDEDGGSILSLSSSESDTEFVVIPMPKCFNMSESFTSTHLQQLSQQFWSAPLANEDKVNKKDKPIEEQEKPHFKKCSAPKTCLSETVSQETGVPEVSENVVVEAVIEIMENSREINAPKQVLVSHLSVDGSSSEISIIESDDSSPSIETFPPAIETMNIAVSSSIAPKKVDSALTTEKAHTNEKSSEQLQNECNPADEITFPKFPVEGIEVDLLIPRPEERTVQVLPEGLLTGALSAAATVYNTARAVISSIQHPRNEQESCLSREFEASNQQTEGQIPHPRELNPMQQLIEMGFCNRELNGQYLQKHKGDLALVVADLVSLNDNDWYASRHTPTCTNFD